MRLKKLLKRLKLTGELMSNTKVCVIGLGYIGLPTAVLIANQSMHVVGVDVNQDAVDKINQGVAHIVEPDLDIALRMAVDGGFLKASLTPEEADVFIIAVPTPFTKDHQADLSYVHAAVESIAPFVRPGNLIVLESTSPPNTTDSICQQLKKARSDLRVPGVDKQPDIAVCYCPERVLPGKILQELVDNDRILGGVTQQCAKKAKLFYQQFVKGECLLTQARTAEMAKLAENAYRDVNIAFANELANIADTQKVNPWELIALANRHPRVNILSPGPGVGGHCIAVDPWFLINVSPDQSSLMRQARHINDARPAYIVEQVKKELVNLNKPTIACLGLSYKRDIDDFRESPALQIVEMLSALKLAKLLVVEPHVNALPPSVNAEHVELTGLSDAIKRADVVLLLVDHQLFREMDQSLLADKKVFDTRGIWQSACVE